jgi:thiosulfate reductase cytochrome b subunit
MSASDVLDSPADPAATAPVEGEVIYRHPLAVRLTHWLNVLAIFFLLLSGLQIFNAHPELYWGKYGADHEKPFIALEAVDAPGHMRGVTTIGPLRLDTTGVLGVSRHHGQWEARGWPAWLTIPSWRDLATGRRWHFFFAWVFVLNGLAYLIYAFASRRVKDTLLPERDQLTARHIARNIADHLRLKHPAGEEARRYNILQKFAYLSVIFVFLPLMVLTGLTMSPGVDAAWPWLLDLFGGRQSARTIHFLSAAFIVLFVLVHVAEVFLAGVVNELGSMITGRYRLPPEHRP